MSVTGEAAYQVSIAFVKFSILTLYGSVFQSSTFRLWLWAVAAFTGAACITGVFGAIFQCVPFQAAWDLTIPGSYCIRYGILAIVITAINIFTDFVILLLPVPLVRRLNTSKKKKRMIMFTFAMGSR
jgi:hypothetical protein